MIELKEQWTGRDQGTVVLYIAAEVPCPMTHSALSEALRRAAQSPHAVHPLDWPEPATKSRAQKGKERDGV